MSHSNEQVTNSDSEKDEFDFDLDYVCEGQYDCFISDLEHEGIDIDTDFATEMYPAFRKHALRFITEVLEITFP